MPNRRYFLLFLVSVLLSLPAFSHDGPVNLVHYPGATGSETEIVRLSGPWQFYYGKQLSAAQMDQLDSREHFYLTTPGNWGNLKRNGVKTPVIGVATYYLKIVVDTSKMRYPRIFAFRIGDITSAYKMYVNGMPVTETGVASSSEKDFKPGYFPHVGYIQTDEDTLRVVLHVSNFFYPHFSGISRPILFGQEVEVSRTHLLITTLSIFLLCILALLFLFELLVFRFYPKDKSHLLVGLLAFIFLLKMLLDKDLTIFHLFPEFSFEFGYRLWLLCLIAVPILFSLMKQWFAAEMNKWTVFAVHLAYGLIALAVIFLPLSFVLQHLMPVIYLSIACTTYLFGVVVLAMYRKRPYAGLHFITFSIAVACVIYDLLVITDPNKVNFISQIGVCIYLITLAYIILVRFIKAQKLTQKLTVELEIANENLEKTVQERTKELQLTNTKLEQVNHQKNFLLASTTHDLKNSFNILINCSDFLLEDKTLTKEQREYVKLVHEATNNGFRVLENILSWSKMQIAEHDGSNVIKDCNGIFGNEISAFHNQMEKKSVNIQVNLTENAPFLCDEEQFYSIIRNLISNAIKFSLPGQTVTISNKVIGSCVEFSVCDTGVGMDSKMLNSLFNNSIDNKRRGTAGEYGTGLGLIIVKELVENNDGTIRCVSEPGKGTEFFIQFPRPFE